jgi:hypothetical protein
VVVVIIAVLECLAQFSVAVWPSHLDIPPALELIDMDILYDPPQLLTAGQTIDWQFLAVSRVSSRELVHLDHDGLIVVDGKEGWYEVPFRAAQAGLVLFRFSYASLEARPVRLSLNGAVVASDACGDVTGGWAQGDLTEAEVGPVWSRKGANLLRVDTANAGFFPHVRAVAMRADSHSRGTFGAEIT